jgi:sporulation protein YlmC with PRC-barrel domain
MTARTAHRLSGTAAPTAERTRTWIGRRVNAGFGTGIGRLEDVWIDTETGMPAWLLIREGRFSSKNHKLVPISGATESGDRIWLPFDKELIRSAPTVDPERMFTADIAAGIREHFGVDERQRPIRRPLRKL